MTLEKFYQINGSDIHVRFEPKLLRIDGSEQVLNALKHDLYANTEELVREIKADYEEAMGKAIAISEDSLMVEIWGHLYASKFAVAVKKLIQLNLIHDAADFVISRSDTIDCGESDIDSNRKFWDLLAGTAKTLASILSKLH